MTQTPEPALGNGDFLPLTAEDIAKPAPTLISIETPEQVDYRKGLARLAAKVAAQREQKRYAWGTAAAALREWARAQGDGAIAKSPSLTHAKLIDEHRGSEGKLTERDDAVYYDQGWAQRTADVGRALLAAFPDPFIITRSTTETRIPAALCRTALVLRIQGERVEATLYRSITGNRPGEKRRNAKGTIWREVPAGDKEDERGNIEVEGVASRLSRATGREITVGDVAAIVRHGMAALTHALVTAGLVPEATRREEDEDMGKDPDRIDGWKGIAEALDLADESSARRWYERYAGMPVRFERSGRVYASRAELQAWRKGEDARVQKLAGAT